MQCLSKVDVIVEYVEIQLITRVLGVLDSPSKLLAFNGPVRPKRLLCAEESTCSGESVMLFGTGLPAISGMKLISLLQLHICVL